MQWWIMISHLSFHMFICSVVYQQHSWWSSGSGFICIWWRDFSQFTHLVGYGSVEAVLFNDQKVSPSGLHENMSFVNISYKFVKQNHPLFIYDNLKQFLYWNLMINWFYLKFLMLVFDIVSHITIPALYIVNFNCFAFLLFCNMFLIYGVYKMFGGCSRPFIL